MEHNHILSLLGLALRGGRLAVGEEPVEGVARARDARVILAASDAAGNTLRRCQHFAQAGQCLWLQLPCTKEEMGRSLGRTSVAVAAVTDVGLAAALVRRLAESDPQRYGEAAERLELKAKRAAERRAEQAAHEKNLRQGKHRQSRPAPQPTPAPQPERSAGPAPRSPRKEAGNGRQETRRSRPAKGRRPKPRTDPYRHSRPVKKGKGSFRKRED